MIVISIVLIVLGILIGYLIHLGLSKRKNQIAADDAETNTPLTQGLSFDIEQPKDVSSIQKEKETQEQIDLFTSPPGSGVRFTPIADIPIN